MNRGTCPGTFLKKLLRHPLRHPPLPLLFPYRLSVILLRKDEMINHPVRQFCRILLRATIVLLRHAKTKH
ncbi:hypothetical protein VU01_14461, partial [Candidatus Electrothrix marina]